jgi:hypothetical protein
MNGMRLNLVGFRSGEKRIVTAPLANFARTSTLKLCRGGGGATAHSSTAFRPNSSTAEKTTPTLSSCASVHASYMPRMRHGVNAHVENQRQAQALSAGDGRVYSLGHRYIPRDPEHIDCQPLSAR